MMKSQYEIKDTAYGRCLILAGRWTPSVKDAMLEDGARGLCLNAQLGWDDADLEFLRELDFLESLNILDWGIRDVTPLHCLRNLKCLSLGMERDPGLDFSRFPVLEDCFLEWSKGDESVFGCKTLRRLYVNSYSGRTSAPFSRLTKLRTLEIGNGPLEEVASLGALRELETLGLYYLRKLTSLDGIQGLPCLRKLELVACNKIRDIVPVGECPSMEALWFRNQRVASLKPIRNHPELTDILLLERCNVVDGDLSPFFSLPKITRVRIRNRRHYIPQEKDIPWGNTRQRQMSTSGGSGSKDGTQ